MLKIILESLSRKNKKISSTMIELKGDIPSGVYNEGFAPLKHDMVKKTIVK
ncbi:hypothetical protein [Chengkuizengella marina]|uniref:hypothetical protein n=1 Tax=Chengkuizengella marina TaxID=2507566 RepID=UPI001371EC0D|nr:hypothetical protein [Chengkuizengella marina]